MSGLGLQVRNKRLWFLLAPALAIQPGSTNAQTGHYWSEQFGNRSTLMLGAVVGTVDDLGAVFYNPARLGLTAGPSLLIGGKAYEVRRVVVEDAFGDGIDARNESFGGAPSLVAGTFTVPWWEGHTFAYSFLPRSRSDVDFFLTSEVTGDHVEIVPGEELLNARIGVKLNHDEEWIGLSWAHGVNETWRLGASAFVVNRDQAIELTTRFASLDMASAVAIALRNRLLKHSTYGVTTKLGVSYHQPGYTLGLTVTTPKLNLTGIEGLT